MSTQSARISDAPEPSDVPTSKKRRPFWRKKPCWIPVVLLGLIYYFYFNGKPLTVSPETTVVLEPLTPDGKTVDFRKRFNDAQDARLLPASENGYRFLIQTLGPRALEQSLAAYSVPWEKFPTDEKTREWFAGYWTRLCAKFELDPAVRPPLLNRLDVWEYLRLNGVDGTEAAPAADSLENAENGTVWVDYAEVPARVSNQVAQDVFGRLYAAPWTAEEFPVAARWVEENADLYAVYEKALEEPRFGAWHFVGDEPLAFIAVLLPDVQALRNVARHLALRANYRIGKGDVDGAIADRRLILRLSGYLFDNPDACLVEYLVGLAIYGIGCAVDVGANPNALPTSEQLANDAENWRETFGAFDFDAAWKRAMNGERLLFFLPTFCDFATAPASRRLEQLCSLSSEACFSDVNDGSAFVKRWFVRALSFVFTSGFDADAFARRANFIWNRSFDANEGYWPDFEGELEKHRFRYFSPSRKVRSEAFADAYLCLMLPATQAAREAFRRSRCVANLTTLQRALLQYQAENGALPPAFTVDADGKPLQSWRVLILPYLGEKEKELFAKIRLDEPWDSEYNRSFQAEAPAIFQCPSHPTGEGTINRRNRFGASLESPKLQPGDASYSVVVGPNSLFDASGVGKNLSELAKNPEKDALSQTLIVERTTPVCWTRPDAEIDENVAFENGVNGGAARPAEEEEEEENRATEPPRDFNPNGIGSLHSGGANVATANDSVRFFSDTIGRYANLPQDDDATPFAQVPTTLETLILGNLRPKETPAESQPEADVDAADDENAAPVSNETSAGPAADDATKQNSDENDAENPAP